MKRLLIISLISTSLLTLGGCTQPDQSMTILQRDGYQHITIDGCGEDDTFRTKSTATKNGQPVSGVVCSGYLKSATV